jgi:hypothetical protein
MEAIRKLAGCIIAIAVLYIPALGIKEDLMVVGF